MGQRDQVYSVPKQQIVDFVHRIRNRSIRTDDRTFHTTRAKMRVVLGHLETK